MKTIPSILTDVTTALSENSKQKAADILALHYPFYPSEKNKRGYTPSQSLKVFLRDGFIDRYTGKKLVYPSALYTIAFELPDAFPLGMGRSQSHHAHWDLFPSVDHLFPVSRGGKDDISNWVTTSMSTNIAKSSSSLEELGWELHEAGDLSEWDGLCSWYLSYVAEHPYLATIKRNKGWHSAVVTTFGIQSFADS